MTQHQSHNENYERDHSHTHCFDQKESPCGIKGKHRCCLCEKEVPHNEWEEALIVEVMEDYLLDCEGLVDDEEGIKREKMRRHFEKLKSFISKTREEAYNDGMRFGRQDEAENCIKHSQEAVNETLATIRERVEKLPFSKAHTYNSENAEIYRAFDNGEENRQRLILEDLDNLERR